MRGRDASAVRVHQALTPIACHLQARLGATVRVLTYGVVPVVAFLGGQLGATVGLRVTVRVGAAGVLLAFRWVLLSPVRSLRALPADTAKAGTAPIG